MPNAPADHIFGDIHNGRNRAGILVAARDQLVGRGPIERGGWQVGHKVLNPLRLVGHFARQEYIILGIVATKGRQIRPIRIGCDPDIRIGEGKDGFGTHGGGLALFVASVTGIVGMATAGLLRRQALSKLRVLRG